MDIRISLAKITVEPNQILAFPATNRALWLEAGSITLDEQRMETGQGWYMDAGFSFCNEGNQRANLLSFEIRNATAPSDVGPNHSLLIDKTATVEDGQHIVRLDKVTFPAGSRAYRHIHPGPGIRYLTKGTLEIQSDHEKQMKLPHTAWFEDANSPVIAIASSTEISEFVRVLVLPKRCSGEPSLKIVNEEDKEKPRLQKNFRYFDCAVDLMP